jgi:predicted ribosome quality control (RQC) complex YloA/Tae2 family protein
VAAREGGSGLGGTGYSQEVIREAALLAARFSKAREERWVEVSYTTVNHVRKPRGSPPGLVILSKEETLTVDLRADEEGKWISHKS